MFFFKLLVSLKKSTPIKNPFNFASKAVGLEADRCEAGIKKEKERADFGRHAGGWQRNEILSLVSEAPLTGTCADFCAEWSAKIN